MPTLVVCERIRSSYSSAISAFRAMRLFAGAVLMMAALLSACGRSPPVLVYDTSGATEEKQVDSRLFYVVQTGDTLSKISRVHETNWKTLAALNKLNEPDNIIPGMRLLIYPGFHLDDEGRLIASIKFAEAVPTDPIELEDAAAGLRGRDYPRSDPAPRASDDDSSESVPAADPSGTPPNSQEAPRRGPPPTVVVGPGAPGNAGTAAPGSQGKPGWQWPVRVRPKFGYTASRKGVDYVLPRGTNIVAAASGRAEYVGPGLIDFKHYVILYHEDGYVSIYGFNVDPAIREEEQVRRGDRLATVNATAEADRRFHFEIRRQGGDPTNPATLLPGY
ncbi:MAG: M23 family metallopeptidase [Pseudomonadales bacterium]|nr:M23 family metallopeptidase [Pseudomonadales bacterium]